MIGSMKGMKAYGRYGSLGFELLLSMGIGYYLGAWADRRLGTHWIALVGFLLGGYAGFRALFKAAKMMQRDIETQEKLDRGEDPWAEPETHDRAQDQEQAQAREENSDGDDAKP